MNNADADRPTPAAVGSQSRLRLPGHWAVRVVAGFCAAAGLFWLSTLRATIERAAGAPNAAVWIAGDVVRAAGFALVAALLWRYSSAVRRYNNAGEPAAESLVRAHAALWRCGGAFLIVYVALVVAVIVTSPVVRFPPGADPATQRDRPAPN